MWKHTVWSRVCTGCQGIQGKTHPLPPQANPLPCQVSPVKSPAIFDTVFTAKTHVKTLNFKCWGPEESLDTHIVGYLN